MSCLNANIPAADLEQIYSTFSKGRFTYLPLNHLDRMIAAKERGNCTAYRFEALLELVNALQANPRFISTARAYRYLFILEARLLHESGQVHESLETIEQAANIDASVDLWLQAAYWVLLGEDDTAVERYLQAAQHLVSNEFEQDRVDRFRNEWQEQDRDD